MHVAHSKAVVEAVVLQRAEKLIVLSLVEINHFLGLCPTHMHLVLRSLDK